MAKQDTLTGRQSAFVREYPVDHNATQAAIRAGYTKDAPSVAGHQVLRSTKVANALAVKETALAEKMAVTLEEIVTGLRTEANGEGPDTNTGGRNQAWGLLAKVTGHMVERRENLNINLSRPVEGVPLTHLQLATRLINACPDPDKLEEVIKGLEEGNGN